MRLGNNEFVRYRVEDSDDMILLLCREVFALTTTNWWWSLLHRASGPSSCSWIRRLAKNYARVVHPDRIQNNDHYDVRSKVTHFFTWMLQEVAPHIDIFTRQRESEKQRNTVSAMPTPLQGFKQSCIQKRPEWAWSVTNSCAACL